MKLFRVHSFAAVASCLAALAASPASATPSACDAVTENLIQNCGFENGITNWGVINAPIGSDQFLSDNPHTGNFSWAFAATDPVPPNWDVIYQIFATTPGDKYHVSFWEESDGQTPNLFFAGFETVPGFNPISSIVLIDQGAGPFQRFSFTFDATQTFSLIYFGGWDVPGFQYLDDVVVRTPEPITLSLFGAGLAGAVAMRRRKKSVA
jgi:hypothetical protein